MELLKDKVAIITGAASVNGIGVNGSLKLTPFEVNRQSKFDSLDDIKFVH